MYSLCACRQFGYFNMAYLVATKIFEYKNWFFKGYSSYRHNPYIHNSPENFIVHCSVLAVMLGKVLSHCKTCTKLIPTILV